jgi:hypothetical protein
MEEPPIPARLSGGSPTAFLPNVVRIHGIANHANAAA